MSYGGTNEAWIVAALRTPIGRHGGALSAVRPDDLGATALEALMERSGVPPAEVQDVLAPGRFPGGGRRRHRQPPVRFWAGSCRLGRARRDAGRGRSVHWRRCRVHEPRPMGSPEAGARVPHRQHHDVRHYLGMALRQPQDGEDGPYRLPWYDRREPRPGEVPTHT